MSESSGGSPWDARIATWTSAMLVVSGLMIVVGFVLPSPEPEAKPAPGYQAMAAPARPVRLVVPSLKIRAPILPIEVSAQAVLDPPRNPRDVGWWKRSARPGAPKGQTVLTGHTVHTGGGVMDDIGKLRKGQLVRVVTPKGAMTYSTTRVVTWSKAELAKRAVDIFSQDRGGRRLVLITCTDWNGSSYDSNVVVFAKPLGVREKADQA
jgi:LPXTG-site transpeptidase (sortase) family protein